ncbi:MAG TPA: hypothetical protein VH988_32025 [Thermoanaerobaculia bacterium]|jgi:hypothetical protein|nr:hypothetical protein [Thermoanaerobaculia bacterium]
MSFQTFFEPGLSPNHNQTVVRPTPGISYQHNQTLAGSTAQPRITANHNQALRIVR